MNSIPTEQGTRAEHEDLRQSSVRELIVQLALAEDEQRKAADPGQIAALTRREQAIVAALHRNGLAFTCLPTATLPRSEWAPSSATDRVV